MVPMPSASRIKSAMETVYRLQAVTTMTQADLLRLHYTLETLEHFHDLVRRMRTARRIAKRVKERNGVA